MAKPFGDNVYLEGDITGVDIMWLSRHKEALGSLGSLVGEGGSGDRMLTQGRVPEQESGELRSNRQQCSEKRRYHHVARGTHNGSGREEGVVSLDLFTGRQGKKLPFFFQDWEGGLENAGSD